jgi:hypothetical protein
MLIFWSHTRSTDMTLKTGLPLYFYRVLAGQEYMELFMSSGLTPPRREGAGQFLPPTLPCSSQGGGLPALPIKGADLRFLVVFRIPEVFS